MSKAATLPQFSPSQGYTYPSPETTKHKFTDLSQRSKEATPLPDTQTSTKSISHTQTDEYISNQLLADTIGISLRYGDEYMDEVPVTGQPGEFRLWTKKQDTSKLAVPGVKVGSSGGGSVVGTPKLSEGLSLKTDVPLQQKKQNKGDKSPKTPAGGPPKPKRRKSKVQVTTPGGTSST
jgi:mediator of RNA polymerase II transcription subunit 6